jgi:hypothetical protein
MQPQSLDVTVEATVLASATASARLGEFPALRKLPPRFAGSNVPGHFLKHADEQTVVALEALRRAIEQFGLDAREQTDWGVIAAPRYIGRLASVEIVRRFAQNGGSTVATHAAAQFSLNSIAGAASIVLGIRGPSLGVGGGSWSIGDGLVAALTLFDPACTPGVWLLLTEWEPEPIMQPGGSPIDGICRAVALAIAPGASRESNLRLCFPGGQTNGASGLAGRAREPATEPELSQIAACVDAAQGGSASGWSCRLPGGGLLELRLAPIARRLRAAV